MEAETLNNLKKQLVKVIQTNTREVINEFYRRHYVKGFYDALTWVINMLNNERNVLSDGQRHIKLNFEELVKDE